MQLMDLQVRSDLIFISQFKCDSSLQQSVTIQSQSLRDTNPTSGFTLSSFLGSGSKSGAVWTSGV